MTTGELEKITINMAPVDLGQIDLLVREGFYQNRTDFLGETGSAPCPGSCSDRASAGRPYGAGGSTGGPRGQ